MEDDLKKKIKIKRKLFSIPPKFRAKPFLGLAQLSKIFVISIIIIGPLAEIVFHWRLLFYVLDVISV
jgi:hypothetical protein